MDAEEPSSVGSRLGCDFGRRSGFARRSRSEHGQSTDRRNAFISRGVLRRTNRMCRQRGSSIAVSYLSVYFPCIFQAHMTIDASGARDRARRQCSRLPFHTSVLRSRRPRVRLTTRAVATSRDVSIHTIESARPQVMSPTSLM